MVPVLSYLVYIYIYIYESSVKPPALHPNILLSATVKFLNAPKGHIVTELKTSTPPSTSNSNESFGIRKSVNIYQLKQQKRHIKHLKGSVSIVDQAI